MWPRATAATGAQAKQQQFLRGDGQWIQPAAGRSADPGWWSCICGEGSYKRPLVLASAATSAHRCWRRRQQVLESHGDRRSGAFGATATDFVSIVFFFCWNQVNVFFAGTSRQQFCYHDVCFLLEPTQIFATMSLFGKSSVPIFCYHHVSIFVRTNQKNCYHVFVW